ncbi:uromodulin-like [Spea bombifrons]|uniref:uromodulin-like n=1 Tax=Spea bombifrons TaxID=233779 RepID=UPI00234999C5|nr:uromodulin-like [Spea bombifrons]
MYQLPLLLIFTIHLASSQYSDGSVYSTPASVQHNCIEREATSFTLLTDNIYPWSYIYAIGRLVLRVSDRYPCGVRQYRAIKLNNTNVTENAVTTKMGFLSTIDNYNFWDVYDSFFSYYNDYNYYEQQYCKQSLLLGLKKALDDSPAGAFILVISSGSMADSNDTVLLNQIFHLLEEKKSQVFFVVYNRCNISSTAESIFNEIASRSFGHIISVDDFSISQVVYGLDLYLAKPLNSLRIMNKNLNTNGVHTDVFNVTSLAYLLITTGGNANFTLADGTGNRVEYEQVLSHVKGRSYLVRNPISGNWYIEITNKGNSSVKVLGFTDLFIVGKCSNYECHPDATCEEFGGYQQCTCRQGYKGDGKVCHDIDECEDYWVHNCNFGNCINYIGSYNCSCYNGFVYEEGLGCVDIDECASAELNDCHPLAVCKNELGWYTCSCPSKYFGDGRYCEVNECAQENNTCFSNADCIKTFGSFSCVDPCFSYTVLAEEWRLTSGRNYSQWYNCDYYLDGWYRFQGKHDHRIPEHCIPEYSCGTDSPMWINGLHPTTEEGIVNRTVCASWSGNCCMWSSSILIRSCPGGFYVYKIKGTPNCNLGYCVEPQLSELNCSTAHCSPDEECTKVNGVSDCHCKDESYDNGLDSNFNSNYLMPELKCGSNQIILSYSKCILERNGFDTSTIHLRDRSCTSYTERWDKSYVRIEMLPRSGSCGAQLLVNQSHLTYANTLYISPKTDGIIQRSEVRVNFSCSYPLNMEVSLWIAVNPFISSTSISIGGTGTYTAKMALYQYSDYTAPYEGSEVWLSAESMLYAGVIIENTWEPNLVLVMRDCYVTPTYESWNPVRYYIIRDSCPNRNDPTISVAENGISRQGRFSVQVFKFVGNYDRIYLHCQIRLCDRTSEICNPQCFRTRSVSTNSDANTTSLTLGPLRLRASSETSQPAIKPAALSSGRAITSSLATLLTLYLLAKILN